jgi:hypothetical protein
MSVVVNAVACEGREVPLRRTDCLVGCVLLACVVAGIEGACATPESAGGPATAAKPSETDRSSTDASAHPAVTFKECVALKNTPVETRCNSGRHVDVKVVNHLPRLFRLEKLCLDVPGYVSTGEVVASNVLEARLDAPQPCGDRPFRVAAILSGTGSLRGYNFEVTSTHLPDEGDYRTEIELLADPNWLEREPARAPMIHWSVWADAGTPSIGEGGAPDAAR